MATAASVATAVAVESLRSSVMPGAKSIAVKPASVGETMGS
jgi:hypothetical protein